MKRIVQAVLLAAVLFTLGGDNVFAQDMMQEPPPIVESTRITDEKIKEYLNEDGTINRKKLNLLVQVFLSSDDDVAKEELKTLYVHGFWQSANIPIGEGVNLLNVFLLLLALVLLSFIGTMFLIIGTVFTFISMVLVKLTSGGTIVSIAVMLQDFIINTILFKQGDGTAFGVRLIILITVFGLIAYVIRQKNVRITEFLQTFMSFVFCAFLVGTLSANTVKIHQIIEDKISTVTDAIFEVPTDKTKEIEEKGLVFNLLQVQPFLMRNFGVTDVSEIDNMCSEQESGQEQFERLLLNDNSGLQDNRFYAEHQTQACENKFIKHSSHPLVEIEIFLISFIGGMSSIVLSFSLDIIYLFRLVIVFIVAFRPTVAMYGMLKKMSMLDFSGVGMVLLMSALWMAVGVGTSLGITISMQLLIKTINLLSSVHPILNLFLGICLLCVAFSALKNWQRVVASIQGALKHAFALARDGFNVDANPFDSLGEHVVMPLSNTGKGLAGAMQSAWMSDKPIKTQEVDDYDVEADDIDLENEIDQSNVADENNEEDVGTGDVADAEMIGEEELEEMPVNNEDKVNIEIENVEDPIVMAEVVGINDEEVINEGYDLGNEKQQQMLKGEETMSYDASYGEKEEAVVMDGDISTEDEYLDDIEGLVE